MNPMWFFIAMFAGYAARGPMLNVYDMIVHRKSREPSILVALWQVFMFLLVVEFWTASVSIVDDIDTITKFLGFLLLPMGIALMARLSEPDRKNTDDDPETYFLHQRLWFFGTLAVLPIVSIARELMNGESIPFDADLVFRIAILVGALIGLAKGTRITRFVHVGAMIALIVAYIFVVYPDITIVPKA